MKSSGQGQQWFFVQQQSGEHPLQSGRDTLNPFRLVGGKAIGLQQDELFGLFLPKWEAGHQAPGTEAVSQQNGLLIGRGFSGERLENAPEIFGRPVGGFPIRLPVEGQIGGQNGVAMQKSLEGFLESSALLCEAMEGPYELRTAAHAMNGQRIIFRQVVQGGFHVGGRRG